MTDGGLGVLMLDRCSRLLFFLDRRQQLPTRGRGLIGCRRRRSIGRGMGSMTAAAASNGGIGIDAREALWAISIGNDLRFVVGGG